MKKQTREEELEKDWKDMTLEEKNGEIDRIFYKGKEVGIKQGRLEALKDVEYRLITVYANLPLDERRRLKKVLNYIKQEIAKLEKK